MHEIVKVHVVDTLRSIIKNQFFSLSGDVVAWQPALCIDTQHVVRNSKKQLNANPIIRSHFQTTGYLADIRNPSGFVLHGRRDEVDHLAGRVSRFVFNNQLEIETVVAGTDGAVPGRAVGAAALAHFARRLARRRTQTLCSDPRAV